MIAERFKYMPIVAVIIAIVMTVLDGTIMNVALPSLTKEFKIEPKYGHLAHQHIPNGHYDVFARLCDCWRYFWLSEGILVRTRLVYPRIGSLRFFLELRIAYRIPHASRHWGFCRHERQYRFGPTHISAKNLRPRHELQCSGRSRQFCCRPDNCRSYPLLIVLALAVCHQHSIRHHRFLFGIQAIACLAKRHRKEIRLPQRHRECPHVRLVHIRP